MFCKIAAGTLLMTFLAGSAFAQGRIATIDLNKAFNGYWKKKDAEALLKDQQTDMEKELKAMSDDYKKINEAYSKLLDSASDPAVSGDEKDKRKGQADDKLKQLKEKQDQYTAFKNRAEMDLAERRKSVISRIISEIRNVVSAEAKKQNYALVMDSGDEAAVVYSNSENDITQVIIKQLNDTAPATIPSEEPKPDKKKK